MTVLNDTRPSIASRGPLVDASDVARVFTVLICLSLLTVATAMWGILPGLLLASVILPFAVYVALHARRQTRGLPVLPGLYASSSFAVFFGAGIAAWVLNGRTIVQFDVAVSNGTVLSVVLLVSLFTTMIVVGEWAVVRGLTSPRDVSHETVEFAAFAQILSVLALCGAFLTVRVLGGWNAAVALLTTHNKTDIAQASGTLGLSLWTVFALPAMTALAIVALERGRLLQTRLLYAAEAGAFAYLSVTLFGSRLLVTLTGLAVLASRFALSETRLRPRVLIAGVSVLLVISGSVLAARPAGAPPSASLARGEVATLGYSIFDVSMTAWEHRSTLGPEFRDWHRSQKIFASVVPLLGPRQARLNDERVDVITARAIGNGPQARTGGLPPSLPTYLLVGFGSIGLTFLGLLIGTALGFGSRLLMRRTTHTYALFFGLWCAFVFNDFKGGDPALDVATELKRWLYLGVLLAGVKVVSAWRS